MGHHAALGPINERMQAVSDAVAKNPVLELKTAAADDTLEGGRQATRALLESGFGPTDRIRHIVCDCLIPKPGTAAQEHHEIVIDPEFYPARIDRRLAKVTHFCGFSAPEPERCRPLVQ